MSETERKVGVTERLLAPIVDIQHHITHGAEPLGCAACPRWDELQSAAVAIVDEVERLITERDQRANRPKGREVGRVGLDYAYSNAIPPPRPTDEDIWREVFLRCLSEYITGEKRVIMADNLLAEYRKRWPR